MANSNEGSSRTALFHRQYLSYSGGHGKVWNYFNHIHRSGLYKPRIYFTPDSVFDETNPWNDVPEMIIPNWQPNKADLLFLAGVDWQAIAGEDRRNVPIVNLIQGVRHADPNLPLYDYLRNRAIRICVSQPVADAILKTGQVNGPVIVIPNGIEFPEPSADENNNDREKIFIGALKNPPIGIQLADQLRNLGYEVDLLIESLPKNKYLRILGKARLAILLPYPIEGFYLPGLEAMALGTPVIMPDCIGNREYAKDGENCLVAAYEDMISAVRKLDSPSEILRLRAAGIETAKIYTLEHEYQSFLEILKNVASLF